ncbi:MAG TPA: hypothetical protein VH256_00270 [Thermoleophilaceae bacterium]|jgi:cytochrome b involved in lipid metabolism|nr:hypothetical protein [Thermoleophilaceae bacterium]
MNSERSQAYTRVVKAVDDMSGSKLHPGEQDTIRHAADALIFCENLQTDPSAEEALADVYELADRLVEADRISHDGAQKLLTDLESCGPFSRAA